MTSESLISERLAFERAHELTRAVQSFQELINADDLVLVT